MLFRCFRSAVWVRIRVCLFVLGALMFLFVCSYGVFSALSSGTLSVGYISWLIFWLLPVVCFWLLGVGLLKCQSSVGHNCLLVLGVLFY